MKHTAPIKIKRPFGYWIFLLMYTFIGLGFFYLNHTVQQKHDEGSVLFYDSMHGSSLHAPIYIRTTHSENWTNDDGQIGAQYDGWIINTYDFDIHNWRIDIKVPPGSFIDSSWNGKYTFVKDTIRISSVDFNEKIDRHTSSTNYGFVMYTSQPFTIESIKLYGTRHYTKEDFSLYWILWVSVIILTVIFLFYITFELRIRRYKLAEIEDKAIITQSLKTFANFIDAKDPYTKGHSTRVSIYAKEIACRMGLSRHEQEMISYIALMHDVGKIGISDGILNKPGALTPEEWRVIEMHTTIGSEILKDFSALPGIAEGAKFHHEKYDGSGYPKGLCGKEIPLYARIICIADAFDAMSSNRCYRSRLSDSKILEELNAGTGTSFDPDLIPFMLDMISDGYTRLVISRYN